MTKAYPGIKGGYAESTVILPKASYVLELENGVMQKSFDDANLNIEPGKTYTVEWNGVAYSCVCEDCDAGGIGAYGLGNTTMIGGTRNEAPFLIMYVYHHSVWGVIDTETAPQFEPITVTMAITIETSHTGEENIGYIEYLVNPKYHMGKPFRGFIGWKLAQGGEGADGEPALVSSDGYTLQDVNGLNLIPKEGK